MPVAKLTKRFVDTVTADARRTLYYDSELTGFCLKVMPSGQMRWCVEYRPGGGGRGVAKKRLVLGWTSALTPEQARTMSRDIPKKPAACSAHVSWDELVDRN